MNKITINNITFNFTDMDEDACMLMVILKDGIFVTCLEYYVGGDKHYWYNTLLNGDNINDAIIQELLDKFTEMVVSKC